MSARWALESAQFVAAALWLYPNQQRRRSAYGANWSHDGIGMRGSWFENDYMNHLILLDFTPSGYITDALGQSRCVGDVGTVLSNNSRVDPRKA